MGGGGGGGGGGVWGEGGEGSGGRGGGGGGGGVIFFRMQNYDCDNRSAYSGCVYAEVCTKCKCGNTLFSLAKPHFQYKSRKFPINLCDLDNKQSDSLLP